MSENNKKIIVNTAEDYICKYLETNDYNSIVLEDIDEMKRLIDKLSNSNDLVLINLLGKLYYYGIYVNQDCEKTVMWYTKATKSGNKDVKILLNILKNNR